jgi:hypothetical protein
VEVHLLEIVDLVDVLAGQGEVEIRAEMAEPAVWVCVSTLLCLYGPTVMCILVDEEPYVRSVQNLGVEMRGRREVADAGLSDFRLHGETGTWVCGVGSKMMHSCGLTVVAEVDPFPGMATVRLSFDVVLTLKTADLGKWTDEGEMAVVRARAESSNWSTTLIARDYDTTLTVIVVMNSWWVVVEAQEVSKTRNYVEEQAAHSDD